jgi:bifunctional oligoribonuclease and PAP phosphatase NrnA
MKLTDLAAIPQQRVESLRNIIGELRPGRTVALSTHMNADGDGCGSEAALAGILMAQGMKVRIVNPTPWPAMFEFLLEGGIEDRTADGPAALKGIDLLIVLDISDVSRLGVLADTVRALKVPRLVIDHHLPSDEPPGEIVLTDTTACATGELVFDLALAIDAELTPHIATALYTALLTDTGGFRFTNTSPRCLAVAAQLLSAGVNPEEMYRRIYASVPLGRMRLLREALDTLEVDEKLGLSWISVPAGAVERFGIRSEDLDGIVEHARSIAGTRLALFFRELPHGKVKVSFRSTDAVDVNALAREFGGGGHARASGALIAGSMDTVRESVLDAARRTLNR